MNLSEGSEEEREELLKNVDFFDCLIFKTKNKSGAIRKALALLRLIVEPRKDDLIRELNKANDVIGTPSELGLKGGIKLTYEYCPECAAVSDFKNGHLGNHSCFLWSDGKCDHCDYVKEDITELFKFFSLDKTLRDAHLEKLEAECVKEDKDDT